ncbi:MAG: hypothetical protein ACOCVR_02500 [Myxococcota bacterium]
MASDRETPRSGTDGRQASRQTILTHSVVGGLIGGVVLAIAAMIASLAQGMGAGAPWQFFASVVLGVPALQAMTTGVLVVGLVVHAVFSALFGLIWGLVVSGIPKGVRDNVGTHAAAASVYGLVIWIVTFQFLARGFYPWFLELNQVVYAVAHVLFYGLPLGLYVAARLGYIESVPEQRRAETRV